MDEKGKVFITLIVLIVVALAFISVSRFISKTTGYGVSEDEKLVVAQCIGWKNVSMYGSSSSEETTKQKEVFGADFKFIKYIACEDNRDVCASLESIPAWKINDKIDYGFKSFEELRNLTEC